MEMTVTSGTIATLIEEAAKSAPAECCGLLLGLDGLINCAVPAANVHADPMRHFEIDPAVLIAAHRAERAGGAKLIGYYHSHPQGHPSPSAVDCEHSSGDGRIWAIICAGQVTFWRDCGGRFEALSTRVVAG